MGINQNTQPKIGSMIVKRRKFLIVIAAFVVLGSVFLRASNAANVNLPGDLNGDNKVTIADLSILLSNFGKPSLTGDLNGDKKVTIADLSILLSNFGKTSTAPNPTPTPTPAPTPPPPAPSPTPTPTPSPTASPSGVGMPVGDLPGWKQIFAEDFTKDAPTGSWASDCDAAKVLYTGTGGTKWVAYPKCYTDTYDKRPYRSDQVLSVHNGVLDFFLRQVDGKPAGANPSPLINGNSQYQTYGRYEARFKVDTPGMGEYYAAWLLWPENDSDYKCAESDFPEGSLDGTVGGFAHYGCGGSQDSIDGGVQYTGWHTYTQEWSPGSRKYYIDGKLVGSSNNQVWSKPQRWQLQTETNGNGNSSGHLLVDWAVVYSYSP